MSTLLRSEIFGRFLRLTFFSTKVGRDTERYVVLLVRITKTNWVVQVGGFYSRKRNSSPHCPRSKFFIESRKSPSMTVLVVSIL